jgi:hypothetical protein
MSIKHGERFRIKRKRSEVGERGEGGKRESFVNWCCGAMLFVPRTSESKSKTKNETE